MMKKKRPNSIPKWLMYLGVSILLFVFILLVILWYYAVEESSWFSGYFVRAHWLLNSLILVFVLIPWKKIYHALNNSLKIKARLKKISDRTLQSLPKIEITNNAFIRKIVISILILVGYITLASIFVVIEVPLSHRITGWIPRVGNFFQSTYGNFVNTCTVLFSTALEHFNLQYFIARPLFFIAGIILIRQVLRSIFLNAFSRSDTYIIQKIEMFFKSPNIFRFVAYLIALSVFIGGIIYIFQRDETSFTLAPEPSENAIIDSTITIQNVDMENLSLLASLDIAEKHHPYVAELCDYDVSSDCVPAEGIPELVASQENLLVNGVPVSVDAEIRGIEQNIQLQLSGSDFLFPFNTYSVMLEVCSPASYRSYCDYSQPNIRDYSTYTVGFTAGNSAYRIYPLNDSFGFYIGYRSYYKLLVGTIFFALFAFLGAIWGTKDRAQLIELSIGVFAAIITLRGFIIPADFIKGPILLDQILLVYLGLFLFTLLYKYSATSSASES